MTQYSNLSQTSRRGGRRPREEYELSTLTKEEREKKIKRRQANKEAAARSRKKKNDQIASLEKDKEALQHLNFQMGLHYNTLKNIAEDFVRSFQAHITSQPSSSSCCFLRDDNALMKLEMLKQNLQNPPPSTYLFQTNGHEHQLQQQQHQQFVQQNNSGDNSTVFLPPESKRSKVEYIGDGQIQYPQQQQISQQPQRFPRPNSLSLSRLNLNDDSCVSPTSSVEEDEEYNFLNQQTCLTPIVANAISVSSTTPTMPPLQFDDLQDF